MENESKKLAWFPAPYLEAVDGEEEDDNNYVGGMVFFLWSQLIFMIQGEL